MSNSGLAIGSPLFVAINAPVTDANIGDRGIEWTKPIDLIGDFPSLYDSAKKLESEQDQATLSG